MTSSPLSPPDAMAAAIAASEERAVAEISRRYPFSGNQLTAALREAYRRALADAGILRPEQKRE